jgi:DHA1 family tetracycline resistance protein-like MFS transporter
VKKSPLLPIFLIVAVDVLGLTIILPLLPFYAEKMGATPTEVGLLVSVYAACQLVAGPLLGKLSDRTGRKPLLLLSQVGTLIGFIILAYAHVLWVVFLARVIDGLTAGNLSLAQAYIADVTKPEDRAKSFGVIGVAFGIGFLIGPAISGFLSQFGYVYPIFAAAALSATSILATYLLLPTVTPEAGAGSSRRVRVFDWGEYADYFRRPGLAPLLWQFFLYVFAFSTFMSGFALFAERRYSWQGHAFGPREVGYVYAFVGFLGIFIQGGLIGRLVKRFGEPRLITAGFISGSAGLTMLGFSHDIPSLLGSAAVNSFGMGAVRPALTSLITQRARRDEQGVVLGLTQSLMSIAQIMAPVIGGFLIDHGLLTFWGLFGAAVNASALLLRGARAVEPQPAAVAQDGK